MLTRKTATVLVTYILEQDKQMAERPFLRVNSVADWPLHRGAVPLLAVYGLLVPHVLMPPTCSRSPEGVISPV